MAFVATSPAHGGGKKKGSITARVIGSAFAGVTEILGFHPVDTIAKRLMSNQSNLFKGELGLFGNLNNVMFKETAEAGLMKKYFSLFPGLGFAASYKILQRIYKFGGQPFVLDALNNKAGKYFDEVFGEKKARSMLHATSGSMIGIGEVVLLPLDVLKIKSQTNPEVLQGKNVMKLFINEKAGLYRGTLWTMARNAPGSFALFGGNSFVYDYIFKLENHRDATFVQNFCASIGGAIASIGVSSPLDTIKTRIQNKPFDSPESGASIFKNLIKNEGPQALFKGLTPKLMVIGPKLIFSFTVAQWMIGRITDMLNKEE